MVYLGVPLGAGQLVLLCWLALFLAVTYTGQERRQDIGLLKLRGAGRRRAWALILGQSAVPILDLVGLPGTGRMRVDDLVPGARRAAAGGARREHRRRSWTAAGGRADEPARFGRPG